MTTRPRERSKVKYSDHFRLFDLWSMGPYGALEVIGLELMSTDFYAGLVIDGRFELVSLLGAGGMGEVWAARHLTLKITVAVKLIRSRWFGDETTIKRFMREARSAAKLQGPHVVKVLDHGRDGQLVYIVLELLEGLSLRAVLRQIDSRLCLRDTRRIFRQLARAVGEAHDEGIVHRDLKPANLFIACSAGDWTVKVMDFGLAKPMDGQNDESFELRTRQSVLVGTPAYMSPERLRLGTTDVYADLWSLAVIAFELLCGVRPFSGKTQFNILVRIATEDPPRPSDMAEVPDGFDGWFAQATASDLDTRFPSVGAMVDVLEQVLSACQDDGGVDITTLLDGAEHDYASVGGSVEFGVDDMLSDSVDATIVGETGTTADNGLGRARLTPIEIAELHTQIQYRLMEQLREEHEKNKSLTALLEQVDTDDE